MDFDTVILVTGKADGPTSVFLAGRLGSLFCILALLIMAFFMAFILQKRLRRSARESRRRSSDGVKRNRCGG